MTELLPLRCPAAAARCRPPPSTPPAAASRPRTRRSPSRRSARPAPDPAGVEPSDLHVPHLLHAARLRADHHEPAVARPRHGGDVLQLRCHGVAVRRPTTPSRLAAFGARPARSAPICSERSRRPSPRSARSAPRRRPPAPPDPPVEPRRPTSSGSPAPFASTQQPGVLRVAVGHPQVARAVPAGRRQPVLRVAPWLVTTGSPSAARRQRRHVQLAAVGETPAALLARRARPPPTRSCLLAVAERARAPASGVVSPSSPAAGRAGACRR